MITKKEELRNVKWQYTNVLYILIPMKGESIKDELDLMN